MSDIESKIKEENENIKGLFNFNGDQSQLEHLKEVFSNYIKSKNDQKYFCSNADLINNTCQKN